MSRTRVLFFVDVRLTLVAWAPETQAKGKDNTAAVLLLLIDSSSRKRLANRPDTRMMHAPAQRSVGKTLLSVLSNIWITLYSARKVDAHAVLAIGDVVRRRTRTCVRQHCPIMTKAVGLRTVSWQPRSSGANLYQN